MPLTTPLPLSIPEPKVKVSSGPSCDIMDFYHTRYSSEHCVENYPSASMQKHRFRHKGTGYGSNIRPVVSYSASVDKESNPYMHGVSTLNCSSHFFFYIFTSGEQNHV